MIQRWLAMFRIDTIVLYKYFYCIFVIYFMEIHFAPSIFVEFCHRKKQKQNSRTITN